MTVHLMTVRRRAATALLGLALSLGCPLPEGPDGGGDGGQEPLGTPFTLLTARPDGSAGAPATTSIFVLSGDGSAVFFLGAGDAGYVAEPGPAGTSGVLYRRALGPGATERVSRDDAGAVRGDVELPTVSHDGRFVAFRSSEPYVGSDENGRADGYRLDLENGGVTLLSASAAGSSLDGVVSSPRIVLSADGAGAAFAYEGDGAITEPPTALVEPGLGLTFLWTPAGTSLVSRALDGSPPATPCVEPAADRDLSHVAVISRSGVLAVADDTPGDDDVLVFSAGGVALADEEADGTDLTADLVDGSLSISDDAEKLAFSALSEVPSCPGTRIFVKDLVTGALLCADARADGTVAAEEASFSPQLSADGRFLLFSSYQRGLDERCTEPLSQTRTHAYLKDLVTGEVACLDQLDGARSGGAVASSMSADGSWITLYARGPGLHPAVVEDDYHGYLARNPFLASPDADAR